MAEIKLPQSDGNLEKRRAELKGQADQYKYNNDIGIPLAAEEREIDENYPDWTAKIVANFLLCRRNLWQCYDKYQWYSPKQRRDLVRLANILKNDGDIGEYFTPDYGFIKGGREQSRPKSFQDYIENVFTMRNSVVGPVYSPVPPIVKNWDSDKTFAYNFVAGPNPNQLERYRSERPPAQLNLTNFKLGEVPGFSGDSIGAAVGEGRVFFVDRSDFTALFERNPKLPHPHATERRFAGLISDELKYTYAPTVAFALPRGGKNLLPIAIRPGVKEDGYEVLTPKDGNSWKMSKVAMLAAHNNHHEVVTHLGLTHLLIDAVVMGTRHQLHPIHPVYKLLNPHFEGTIKINIGARTSLILPEKSVDRLVGSKIEMNYPYLGKARLNYNFRDNFLPVRLERMGVRDPGKIPLYPYRDDGLLIWEAIKNWVSAYISIWYTSDGDVRGDYEIQNWAKEIETTGKVLGFTKGGGAIGDRNELIEILTMVIFTAGPQHAAVNFPQGSEMLFVPANPLGGYAPAPKGREHSEQDYLDMFPPMDVAIQTWNILSLLAGINNTRLGNYRKSFVLNPKSLTEEGRFKLKLWEIETKIKESNKVRKAVFDLEYVHLLPSRIPASINI